MDIKEILNKLSFSENLTEIEAEAAMNLIMSGDISEPKIASFLTAMRIKGETVEELTAFVKVLREKAIKVDVNIDGAIDLVGTGGDQTGTFNISTAASFITAAAGIPVIKHGNRSASSKCGSADVLEHLGAAIELGKEQVEEMFKELGMAFMFAPMFHPAMKHVMPTRRELGFRTFFNILGPMVNPAGVQRYVIGAFNKDTAFKMIQILSKLNTDFAYTFNAHDGLDEVSLTSQSEIFELKDRIVSDAVMFDPESIGYQKVSMRDIMGGGKEENAEILTNIMANNGTEAQQNIALLNAAFAIQASGKVKSLKEAKVMAEDSLQSGEANKLFKKFIDYSNDVMITFKY